MDQIQPKNSNPDDIELTTQKSSATINGLENDKKIHTFTSEWYFKTQKMQNDSYFSEKYFWNKIKSNIIRNMYLTESENQT